MCIFPVLFLCMYIPTTVHIQTSALDEMVQSMLSCSLRYVLEIFPDQNMLDCHESLNCCLNVGLKEQLLRTPCTRSFSSGISLRNTFSCVLSSNIILSAMFNSSTLTSQSFDSEVNPSVSLWFFHNPEPWAIKDSSGVGYYRTRREKPSPIFLTLYF